MFYSSEKEPLVKEALKSISYTPQLFLLDELGAIKREETPDDIFPTDEERTAVIIYTSGTTGSPKGVMLSYKNLYANMKSVTHDIPIYQPGERVMILLPLHHIFPLLGTLIVVMYSGATAVMAPAMTNEHIIGTLQKHKVSIIVGVPRLYSMIRKGIMDKIKANKAASAFFSVAKTFQSRKLSKTLFGTIHKKFGGAVKYMVCGGAPLDPEVAKDYKTLGFEMLEGYGMTESSPMISFTRPGQWKIGAAGQLMPGVEVKIRDGEITARGNNIMKGYFNRPEETNQVLKEGWLYTGDLGHVDKNEYLYITGRKKEIIVLSSGKNINPNYLEADIEEKLDGIEEIAVLQYNDRLHALIRPEDSFFKEKTKELMGEFFRKQLKMKYNNLVASYKRIGKFTIVEQELPRTRLGKLRRFKLEELLHAPEAATPKAAKTPEADFRELQIIRDFIENQKSIEVSPDDHLEFDIGMDSLDKVSLQTFLENSFGVNINTEKFMNFPSVAKLAEYIKEKKSKFSIVEY
ncbi:MAG: AMP-binding protein [Bacteroidales bacterium]|nr:AMP-binding protein [Bacteroidales bacterium]